MGTFYNDLHNTVRNRFKVQVEDVESVTTLYDNDPTDEPDAAIWVRWQVQPGQAFQAETGGIKNNHRVPGFGIAQIFGEINLGDKIILELADKIKDAFLTVTQNGVIFQTTFLTIVGRQGNNWQVNVNCPFYADDNA